MTNHATAELPPRLSLVVPVRNERDNVRPLVTAVALALGNAHWELIFVDDSDDGTDQVVQEVAAQEPRVRLFKRTVNRGGLAGAVVDGFGVSRGEFVCVLDGDLQHPPDVVPKLLARAAQRNADVVIASRYIPGGDPGGLAGPLRQIYSRGLKYLAKLLFPLRLRGITDPLGGFFLVRRSVISGVELRPVGYKILLEILIRGRWSRAAEAPYRFAPREAGTTKADFRQGLRFLQHLARLSWDCSPLLGLLHRLPLPGRKQSS